MIGRYRFSFILQTLPALALLFCPPALADGEVSASVVATPEITIVEKPLPASIEVTDQALKSQFEELHSLAHEVHEALERENPDLSGLQSWVEKFWYNWNYFRTMVNQMRLAHSLGEESHGVQDDIKNMSLVALGTHLSEHLIGHGTHYLATYSSNPFIYWTGTVVGEAIASPFVEVVCIAGVFVYAKSDRFRKGVTTLRVAGYDKIIKPWGEPLAQAIGLPWLRDRILESRSGKEQLLRALADPGKMRFVLQVPEEELAFDVISRTGRVLARLKLDLRENQDVVLRSVWFEPTTWNKKEKQDLAKGLKAFGWNIRDAILGSAKLIQKNQLGMLSREVFFGGLTREESSYVLSFKNDAIRRFRRSFLRNPCAAWLAEPGAFEDVGQTP